MELPWRPEDSKVVEDMCLEKLSHWRRRKRMFKDLWDAITENSPKDLKEFKVINVVYV
jgi:26S proteasome regulatory subunit (ATPase 3-interacting protein)